MFPSTHTYDSHMELSSVDYRMFKKAFEETKRDALNGWKSATKESRFQPYSFEGGTAAAIAGENFVVIGADTRLSTNGSVVQSRHLDKVFKLDNNIVLASTGFYGDLLQLVRVLRARMKVYQFTYNEPMNIDGAAQMLARTLYYKRFFPYYTQNMIGGIDCNGKGALYGYDPVGNIERTDCDCSGSGNEILQPFLDSQVRWSNKPANTRPELTLDRAKKILRDGFRAVAERDVSTGDALVFVIIQAGKPVEEEIVPLRGD